ncbi:MAG: rhodanese-like domain-containing protein [Thiobacillus sp.]|nr:rhodanese-like domain-containing protein [Thiobacillus sp.]
MPAHRVSLATLAAFLLLAITACSQDSGPTLTAPDAYAQAQAGTLTLIDIRHPDEWRQTGVAKGALRIDMTDAQGESGFVQRVATEMGGKKNAPIALLSLAGNRGSNAQQVLRKAGFTQVYNVREGMNGSSAGPGWIARGLPMLPCPDC